MPRTTLLADSLARFVGSLLVATGPAWHIIPVRGAHIFGITDATEETARFYPALGGRNFGVGLATLILSFTGQRRAVGTVLACWMATGLADTRICWVHGEKWLLHFGNTVVLGGIAVLQFLSG